MATARYYALNANVNSEFGKKYVSNLKGQAKIVFEEMKNDATPRLATAINEKTEKLLKTRQDTLRVTLYYIIVFKGKGIVSSFDSMPNPETGEVVDNFIPETVKE